MARLVTYLTDDSISNEDIILGSDGSLSNPGATKNFTVEALSSFIQNEITIEGIPGPTGPQGPQGPQGIPGTNASVNNDEYVRNTTDTFTSTQKVLQIVTLSASEYAGITPNSSTIYVIL